MKAVMVAADAAGHIFDIPDLGMLADRCGHLHAPDADELMPLPSESELMFLPGRVALGLDPRSGQAVATQHLAVAAFPAPGHTISGQPAYLEQAGAPLLPLFAYGAVGYAQGKFWIAAKKVDNDERQKFSGIRREKIAKNASRLLRSYPRNRLVNHIIKNCVWRYDCPAARNFALGRYEAPLPTARACNAACLGCISLQSQDSPLKATPQCRLNFTPSPEEIAEVMRIHSGREKQRPIYSFGQGCEGDPLVNPELLRESIAMFRKGGGRNPGPGTINCNTNASNPAAVLALAQAGLTSMRVSLNSAVPEYYHAYYRPTNYSFEDVRQSMRIARLNGVFVSLNLLYFPGFTDSARQMDALAALCRECGVSLVQLRNLNIDPGWYKRELGLDQPGVVETPVGLNAFLKKIARACPWLKFGYFNPYLGEKADIAAPMPV